MSYYTTNSTYGSFYNQYQNQKKKYYESLNNFKEKQQQYYDNKTPNKNEFAHKTHFPEGKTNRQDEHMYGSDEKELPLKNYIVPSLTGLQNLGNTCYINTCLQNLIHCESFIFKFLDTFKGYKNTTPISNTFYDLLTQISINNKFEKRDYLSPTDFVNTFRGLHKNFEGFQEHDTQEFCRYLLQDLNSELNEIKDPSSYKAELPRNKDKKESLEIYKKDCLSKEKSLIQDIFIGYFSFEYLCDCGYKEYTFSQFLDLPIQMDSNVQGYDLYQMLRHNFYKKSYVDMGENCSFCKRTSKKYEIMKIASLPTILIISLQRINPVSGLKNEAKVKFYEGLDLREMIDTETLKSGYTKYDLFAVSNHIGNINTGHYYSNIKIGNIWYCFEDSKVYKIGAQIDMNTKEVYTLFYKKVDH